MFQSIDIKNANTYILTDDDFTTTVNTHITSDIGVVYSLSIAIAVEYTKRDINTAAQNIAMYILYKNPILSIIIDPIFYQDTYCPHLISSWSEIAKERDKYIEMLSLLK